MDPVTGLGIASSSISIIAKLVPTILALKETWDGIKQVDETNTGFIEELLAFEFSLNVIDVELRKENSAIEQSEWWNSSRMTDLLHNAVKTLSRLDVIFKDMSRRRKFLEAARKYYRGRLYETEISHLTNRLRTYTSCLTLPTTVVAISSQLSSMNDSKATSSTETASMGDGSMGSDDSSTLFEKEVVVTNDAIRTVLEDSKNVCVSLDQREDDPKTSVKDSQELVELAASIVNVMSSVASDAGIQTKPFDVSTAGARMWENASVSGVPLSDESNRFLQAWSNGIPGQSRSGNSFEARPSMGRFSMFNDEHTDLDARLIRHRFDLARQLYTERKFKEAVVYLEKFLSMVDEHSDVYQDIEWFLVKNLMEIKPLPPRTEILLSHISNNSTDVRHAESLGLLATVRMELYPKDLEKAKDVCQKAARAQQSIFGLHHEQTVSSIWLMTHLCTATNNPEAMIWRLMLPEHLRALEPAHGDFNRATSPFVRPPSSPEQSRKIIKLESDVQRLRKLIADKDDELTKTAQQVRDLKETSLLKGDMLDMTKSSHQDIQDKYLKLKHEHEILITTKTTLEQMLEQLKRDNEKLQRERIELVQAEETSRNEAANNMREIGRLTDVVKTTLSHAERENQGKKLKQIELARAEEASRKKADDDMREIQRLNDVIKTTLARVEYEKRRNAQDRKELVAERREAIANLENMHVELRHELAMKEEEIEKQHQDIQNHRLLHEAQIAELDRRHDRQLHELKNDNERLRQDLHEIENCVRQEYETRERQANVMHQEKMRELTMKSENLLGALIKEVGANKLLEEEHAQEMQRLHAKYAFLEKTDLEQAHETLSTVLKLLKGLDPANRDLVACDDVEKAAQMAGDLYKVACDNWRKLSTRVESSQASIPAVADLKASENKDTDHLRSLQQVDSNRKAPSPDDLWARIMWEDKERYLENKGARPLSESQSANETKLEDAGSTSKPKPLVKSPARRQLDHTPKRDADPPPPRLRARSHTDLIRGSLTEVADPRCNENVKGVTASRRAATPTNSRAMDSKKSSLKEKLFGKPTGMLIPVMGHGVDSDCKQQTPQPGQPPLLKTNVNRAKTKKWVEAKQSFYGGDDWDDYTEDDEYAASLQ